MPLHRVLKHPEYVEGCFGCKDVNDAMVPGNNAKNGNIPKQKVEHKK